MKNNQNTLLITLEYPPFKGGVANYYGNLATHWPEADSIFVLDNNENKLINQKLPAIKWLPAFWQLYKNIKKNKIKHVIVGHILPLGTVTWLLSKIMDFKYSVTLHGMDFAFANRQARKKSLTKKILSQAENIICANSYLKKLIIAEFGNLREKIEVINPGINTEISSNQNLINKIKDEYELEGKTIMFSVGRLVRRKGFDNALKALPIAMDKNPSLIYAIMGIGPDEEYLKDIIKNLDQKYQEKIIFLTSTSDEEKWAWLFLCDIFVMPSRNINGDFEGFGIVYLEANLAGKPVIAGDSGGIADAVENGINGLLVDPESINDITYAIDKLAGDEDLRKKLGKEGRIRSNDEFNWNNQVSKIYKTINK